MASEPGWQAHWNHLSQTSVLKQSQNRSPDLWDRFYDRVAPTWEALSGMPQGPARRIASRLGEMQLIHPGCQVLELGCGTGSLSLALGDKGCRVTALDKSTGMIGMLKKKLSGTRRTTISPCTGNWQDLPLEKSHDTVLAAFFPDAFSPDGLRRMEALARTSCILVIGSGRETFPLRRRIWEQVMPEPCQPLGHHLAFAKSFLWETSRHPAVTELACPVESQVSPDAAREYFRAYFHLFAVEGPDLDLAIDNAISPYIQGDTLHLAGQMHVTLISWALP